MHKEYRFWVYMMTNVSNRVIYVGMTNDIARRVYEHVNGLVDSFTKRYNVHKLVYVEEHQYVNNAIAREKEFKKFSRQAKLELIEGFNPGWNDLGKQMGLVA